VHHQEDQESQKMNKKIKVGIRNLPFFILLLDLVWWMLSFFGIYLSDYWFIGEITSHSLAFVLFMAYYAYVHRFCLYSWIAIIGIGLLNLLNIVYFFLPLEYIQVYVGIIIIISLILSILKWKQAQF